MSFVKKTLPLIFGMVVGWFAFIEFYIPHYQVKGLKDDLLNWAAILTAAAYVVGAVNVMQVNLPRIRRRERDWHYKVVLLAAAAAMFTVGMLNLVVKPGGAGTVVIKPGAEPAAQVAGKAVVVFDAPDDVMVTAAGLVGKPGRSAAGPATYEVDPGPVTFRAFRRVAGYKEFNEEVWHAVQIAEHEAKRDRLTRRLAEAPSAERGLIEGELEAFNRVLPPPKVPVLAAGDVMVVKTDPPMMWGKEGRPFTWLYDHVFAPCNATMFALLAFFVASAAFRAFRARNIEAGLLLGGAILVMLGRVPVGRLISENLPSIAQWILDVPNNGSRRAIMMGAAIGAIATGLRILLGLERSHIGSDE